MVISAMGKNKAEWGGMMGRRMASKDVHTPILEICEYVTLHSKKHFAEAIKLRILRRRVYPAQSGRLIIITWVFKSRKIFQLKKKCENRTSEMTAYEGLNPQLLTWKMDEAKSVISL